MNETFLNDLPEGVDPCGENGKSHAFCFDGPILSKPVSFETVEKAFSVEKNEYSRITEALDAGFCNALFGFVKH